jgi:hypothetical protein
MLTTKFGWKPTDTGHYLICKPYYPPHLKKRSYSEHIIDLLLCDKNTKTEVTESGVRHGLYWSVCPLCFIIQLSSLSQKEVFRIIKAPWFSVCTVYEGSYSGISIYLSRNVRFLIFTVRHLWSRIKFHINNVIYFRINRSCELSFFLHLFLVNHGPDTLFPTWIFSHGSFEKKNWSELFMWDPCCTPAPHMADCMYVYSVPVFICGTSPPPGVTAESRAF